MCGHTELRSEIHEFKGPLRFDQLLYPSCLVNLVRIWPLGAMAMFLSNLHRFAYFGGRKGIFYSFFSHLLYCRMPEHLLCVSQVLSQTNGSD